MKRFLVICALLVAALGCSRNDAFEFDAHYGGSTPLRSSEHARETTKETRHVLIMVSAGFNSLSAYMREDLDSLEHHYLTGGARQENQLVILARLPQVDGGYSDGAAPVLYRAYNKNEELVRDTLKVFDGKDQICDTLIFRQALEIVQEKVPAKSYGMVLSSHASGWLPNGYYFNPNAYETAHGGTGSDDGITLWNTRQAPLEESPAIPEWPAVKSIGQDKGNPDIEMELAPFVRALPFRLDYLLLDACLSGCVEVAWELRGKADIVGFSQAEILADGFNYNTLTSWLIKDTPDPVGVCREYFEHYDALSGVYRSATISAIDTRKMDALASVCKTLFEKYRTRLSTMSDSGVQRYFRADRHYFYDMKDILVHAGITEQEQAQLDAALQECVLYCAATPMLLGSYALENVCGFSMYLPSRGTRVLNRFYKQTLAWNKATELVQ